MTKDDLHNISEIIMNEPTPKGERTTRYSILKDVYNYYTYDSTN